MKDPNVDHTVSTVHAGHGKLVQNKQLKSDLLKDNTDNRSLELKLVRDELVSGRRLALGRVDPLLPDIGNHLGRSCQNTGAPSLTNNTPCMPGTVTTHHDVVIIGRRGLYLPGDATNPFGKKVA
jgi:hypothetical protein